MSKLLLPIDGSECCLRAVDYVIGLVRRAQTPPEVHILTVHPPIPYANVASAVGHDTLNRFYREEGEATLKASRERLDAAGVQYRPHISVGDPADIISRFVAEQKIDQIVMGTRGLGAVTNLLLGSVASKVIHLVSTPITLVK
ncbi:MAG: universal stress protein [Acidobacteria bacterium]|nr:universal stress protein [Acidobacteriota bacterium]